MKADVVMQKAFGDMEWWKSGSEASFKAAAIALLAWGVSADDAADLLEALYHAAAAEFGG